MLSTQTTPKTRHISPAQRPYTAYGAMAELWKSRAPEIVLSGPAGPGKSRGCLEKLHFCALKYSGMRALIVRKTRESLTEAALVTYEEHVLPEFSPLKLGPKRNFRQSYHYPTGSEIVVGGLDKPGKIMSTEYDMIYVQEATELELDGWQALTTRLRNGNMPYQQIIGDCNPDAPTHWLWLRSQGGLLTLLNARHEDNPRLWNGRAWTEEGRRYIETLDRLQGTEHQRLRLGLWVQASGLVFDTWSDGPDDGNVTAAADYQANAGPVLWAVDDGYSGKLDANTGLYGANSHPRVFLLCQLRPNGQLCVFAESFATELLSDVHIRRVLDLAYPLPEYAVVDKSAAELRGRLYSEGIYTKNGPADVEESIKNARRWIAADQNGVRKVLVHPRCKHLRAEMVSYRRDDATGKVIKAFDHGPDSLRYLLWVLRYE